MFVQNDVVEIHSIPERDKQALAAALGVPFCDITFYFIDYEFDKEGEKFAVLSAETLEKFTIVHCHIDLLENPYNQLINELCNYLLINGALDRYNKTGDKGHLEFAKQLSSPNEENSSAPRIRIGDVVEEYDDMYDEEFDEDDPYFN